MYSEVFWKGCLPGSQGNLCKVCVGGTGEAATKRCADHHNERYYGNMGALRYLGFLFSKVVMPSLGWRPAIRTDVVNLYFLLLPPAPDD